MRGRPLSLSLSLSPRQNVAVVACALALWIWPNYKAQKQAPPSARLLPGWPQTPEGRTVALRATIRLRELEVPAAGFHNSYIGGSAWVSQVTTGRPADPTHVPTRSGPLAR
jgi:hypothetical protein